MKKQLYYFLLSVLAFGLSSFAADAQTKSLTQIKQKTAAAAAKLSGVYAAISTDFHINNAVEINTHTYYFRADGTFATELDKPDWRTRVDGTFTVKGKIVTVLKKGVNASETIEIQENGTLKEAGYFLSKHEFANSIPAKRLEYQGAASSGVGAGAVHIGSTANRVFIFDGRGKFTNDESNAFTVSSDTFYDGGGRNDNKASGTYTIKDSVLTLKYADGAIRTASFFFNDRQSNNEVSALIDGKFYFEGKPEPSAAVNKTKKRTPPAKSQTATQKFEAVYANVKVSYGVFGAQTSTVSYYFRSDGTLATELDQADWKTRVDGTYTKRDNTIIVRLKDDDEPRTMTLEANGDAVIDNLALAKFDVMNSVPAKRFENNSAIGTGGSATGTTYVGVFSSGVYVFDGNGRFANDNSTAVAVAGENIGGGNSNSAGGAGVYTIKDSLLTLKYPDGKTATVSFFYTDKAGVMALINGRILFEDKPENELNVAAEKKKETPQEKFATTASDASSVLKAANRVHGGTKLDSLKTLRIKGRLTGANAAIDHDVVMIYDFGSQKVRNEILQNGKYVAVEQLDGAKSFAWTNNRKSDLPAARAAEIKQSLFTGIFGLRADVLKSIQIVSSEVDKDSKTIRVLINGKKYDWLFNSENHLIGETIEQTDGQQTDFSDDFRLVNGILLPFSNASQLGETILELKVASIEINPNLTEKDWDAPR